MLFALSHPAALIGLVLGFFVGVILVGATQTRMTARSGALTSARLRERVRPSAHIDPFGAIAAALGGVGWAASPEVGRWNRGPQRRRAVLSCLVAPGVHLALAVAALIGLFALGDAGSLTVVEPRIALHGEYALPLESLTLLGFGVVNLTMALLHFVPLPPMAAGRILFLLAPQTRQWQRAEFHLQEQNWGLGILLFLSLPLFNYFSLSATLTSAIGRPILLLFAGLGDG